MQIKFLRFSQKLEVKKKILFCWKNILVLLLLFSINTTTYIAVEINLYYLQNGCHAEKCWPVRDCRWDKATPPVVCSGVAPSHYLYGYVGPVVDQLASLALACVSSAAAVVLD